MVFLLFFLRLAGAGAGADGALRLQVGSFTPVASATPSTIRFSTSPTFFSPTLAASCSCGLYRPACLPQISPDAPLLFDLDHLIHLISDPIFGPLPKPTPAYHVIGMGVVSASVTVHGGYHPCRDIEFEH